MYKEVFQDMLLVMPRALRNPSQFWEKHDM